MTKAQEIARLLKSIEACRARLASERDKLREYIGDLESIADDMDEADSNITEGIRALTDGADAASRLI